MNFESPEVIRERRLEAVEAVEADQASAARERGELRDEVRAAERRIRDEVFRVGARVAATVFAVGALLAGERPGGWWCVVGFIVCLFCAGRPSATTARKVTASVRVHPWVWAITAVLGVGGGLSAGHAIGHPSPLWLTTAGLLLGLGVLWAALILRASSHNRKAA